MNKPKPVVSRTDSGRYRLQLSQQQSRVMSMMLQSASDNQGKATSNCAPHFTTVILLGVLKRLHRRIARKLIDAPAKGLGLTLSTDELASLGEVLGDLRQIEGVELISMLFAPIHQILS